MPKLAGKVSIVTGAAAGIGIAIAGLFAREGAFVVIADRDEVGGEAAARAICEAGGQAEVIAADVAKEDNVRRLLEAVQKRFDAVDVLVNNAGNFIRKDFRHLEDADLACILDTHLWGTVRVTRAFLPLLQRAGAAGGASVVNLSSIMATQHIRQAATYSAAKGAIEGLTRSLAVELAPLGVRVNALCPGFVPTAMTRQYTRPGYSQTLLRKIPMRRFGEPTEIAKAALFLACDDSSYITGHALTADGGMSIALI